MEHTLLYYLARGVFPKFPMITALALAGLLQLAGVEGQAGPSNQERAFTGAGSCASSNCHGGVWAKTGEGIGQDEYTTWAGKDAHSNAFRTLLEPRSQEIARHLGTLAPEKSDQCLDCHALNAVSARRAKSFDLTDGVSCENCHGPASDWLGSHTLREWTHEQSLELGMYDTKDLLLRTRLCLACHLGNEQKSVDHELIAAGHPDLIFELDTFSALMPRHWREEEGWEAVRRWGVGQTVALGESMRQLARRASGQAWSAWPEFADFECFACHHNLVLPSSRQSLGYRGRAGIPTWNPSRYLVLRQLVGLVSPSEGKSLDGLIEQLEVHLQKAALQREKVAATATQVAVWTDDFLPQFQAVFLNEEFSLNLMKAVATQAAEISGSGLRTAEQATLALDTLYHSHRESMGRENQSLDALINQLYQSLQSTSRYDPEEFASLLRQAGQQLKQQ